MHTGMTPARGRTWLSALLALCLSMAGLAAMYPDDTALASMGEKALGAGPLHIYARDVLGTRVLWNNGSGYKVQHYKHIYPFVRLNNTTYSSYDGSYGNGFTPVSHEVTPGVLKTVVRLTGRPDITLTQKITYVDGRLDYRYEWILTNTGTTTYQNPRFLFGGDTYFAYDDYSTGYWDPNLRMVYLKNPTLNAAGFMGLMSDSSTPSSHYYEANYSSVWSALSGGGPLNDTVNQSYVDAGYALQWDRAALGPGESWRIIAYEKWTAAGTVQVIAPSDAIAVPGATSECRFLLRNMDTVERTCTLSATSQWPSTIVGGNTRVLAPGESVYVTVLLSVPFGVGGGASDTLMLTATTQGAGSISDSVVVMTLAQPCPVLKAPADGSTVAAPVTLMWEATPGADRYRLQLCASAAFTTGVIDSGPLGNVTSKQIVTTLLRDTVYYWRVMAGGAQGWSGWSAPWSFRTQGGPPDAPLLSLPGHGATNVSRNATLVWNVAARATSYRVQVSRETAFTTPLLNEITTATQWATSGLPCNAVLYWRVKAHSDGQESGWSTTFRFTTEAPLATPVLKSPGHGAQDVARPVTLTWQPVTGADRYLVQMADTPTFSPTLMAEYTDAPSLEAARAEPGGTYYWRVRAFGPAGESYWATAHVFATRSAPGAPTLLSPAHGATQVRVPTVLSWTPVTAADRYVVEVSVNADCRLPLVRETVTGTTLTAPDLAPGGLYYWRVRAVRGIDHGAWSPVWRFSTLSGPPAPALQSPLDGATGVNGAATLTWAAAPLAASYQVQVSTAADFPGVAPVAVGGTSYPATGLAAGTPYWWRVRAVNAAGTGAWSPAWRFTTLGVPEAPVILGPPAGAAGVPTPARLTWRAVAGATSYEVQVFSDEARTQRVVALPSLAETVAEVTLAGNTRYWWQVRATNALGTGPWATSDFATTLLPPGGTMLLAPGNGDAVLKPVVLQWAPATSAASYWVQVSRDPDFTSLVLNADNVTITSTAFATATAWTSYWWRVKAWNACGQSAWSPVRSFRVIAGTTLQAAPALLGPADGAGGVVLPTPLTWTAVSGALRYEVQVATDASFARCVVRTDTPRSPTFTVGSQLSLHVAYCWRVRALNDSGPGPWSAVAWFTPGPSL